MALNIAKRPYTEKWKKVKRIFSENYSRIYICKSTDGSQTEYILKIFDNLLDGNNDVTDTKTITIHYKLGLKNLTPAILDCGYYDNVPLDEGDYESLESEDSSDFTSESSYDSDTSESDESTISESMSGSSGSSESESGGFEPPKSPHLYYMVLPKYQADGDKYLMKIFEDADLSQNKKDELYREYMTQVFDLYNKMADLCICSYDAKNRNVMLNYDISYKILEMRLIDVDFNICKTFAKSEEHKQLCFAGMLLVHYVASRNDADEDYFNTAYRKCYVGLVNDKLLNYRKLAVLDSKISFKKLFYCYYTDMHFDDYDRMDEKKRDKLYKSAFKHIAKKFV
jgi:hypothetical protein